MAQKDDMKKSRIKIDVDAKAGPAEPPEVLIYTTPSCPYCVAAKEYLAQGSMKFTDIDVSIDQEKAREMIAKSGQAAVPVLEINGRIVVGFDRQLIDDALKREKPPKREAFLQNLFFDYFSK